MLEFNFTPFPNLETQRLRLRRLQIKDVDETLALRSNPEIMKYIPRPLITTKEEALKFIETMDTNINSNSLINIYYKYAFKYLKAKLQSKSFVLSSKL